MKKHITRLSALAVCIVCAVTLLGTEAMALAPIEPDRTVSARLTFLYGNMPVPDAEFSLYRIADVSQWAEFTFCGEFKAYSGQIDALETAEEWAEAAEGLTEYIRLHRIQPLYVARTDSRGRVYFGSSLKSGLYLYLCGETEYKGRIYTALPGMLCLPCLAENTDDWIYENAEVQVKAGDTRDVPPSPTPPAKPKPPAPSGKLPQTGLLWWPVPVLTVAGLLFVTIGSIRRRSC